MTNDFGRWLRGQLTRREMSMTAFASKIGVSHSSVSLWLDGKRVPTPRSIDKIADVFVGTDRDMLLALAGHRPRLPLSHLEKFHSIADPYARHLDWDDPEVQLAIVTTLEQQIRIKEMRTGKRTQETFFAPVELDEE